MSFTTWRKLIVHDYGAEYEYGNFNITFSEWGWLTLSMETTVKRAPWYHAEEVECEILFQDQKYTFTGTVHAEKVHVTPDENASVHIKIMASDYSVERV